MTGTRARPAYFNLDLSFRRNPKIDELTEMGGNGWQAIVMWLDGLAYSTHHLTDGFIPARWPRSNGYGPGCAALLVKVELWWEVADLGIADDGPPRPAGWLINDYDAYQVSRAGWTAEGRKRREASAKGNAARWGRSNGQPHPISDPIPHPKSDPISDSRID